MKPSLKHYSGRLFEYSSFFYIGAVLSLIHVMGGSFFGASPHYLLMGTGIFIASTTIPRPPKVFPLLLFPLLLIYFFPVYPIFIVTAICLGTLVTPTIHHRSSFIFILLSFLFSTLHIAVGLFIIFGYVAIELFNPTRVEQKLGSPSFLLHGVILSITTVIPFIFLRTTVFLPVQVWTIYLAGLLLPLGLLSSIKVPKLVQNICILLPAASYFGFGPLVVQLNQASRPYPYELALLIGLSIAHGAMLSLAVPKTYKTSWIGIGIGIIIASVTPYGWGFIIGACFFIGLLFSAEPKIKIISAFGMGLFLFGGFSSRGPDAPLHIQSLFRSRENQVLSFDTPIWNANASFSITPEADAPKYFDDDTPSRIEIEGSFVLLNDRRASAERYAGLITRALHPSPHKMLVFGDYTANTFTLIQNNLPEQTLSTTPIPKFTQALANSNPTRKNILLSPEIQLLGFHPQEILQRESNVDIVIDILHSPIENAINHPNTSFRIAQIQKVLSNNGIYAQLIHLRDFPEGAPQNQADLLAKNFSFVQLWLPPQGADTILLIGSSNPFSWSTFSDFLQKNSYDVMEIGSLAIGDIDSAIQWVKQTEAKTQYPLQPILHLATLERFVSSPQDIWNDPPEGLEEQLAVKQRFLSILKKAGEGKVNEVFQEASALFQGATDPGVTLAPLLAPHLKDAKKSIALARLEGQKSKHWEEAKKYAMTASMLSPKNPIPKGLLGEIAIGQGLPELAKKHFEEILKENPKNIVAIHGMARIYGLEDNEEEVEKWLNEAIAQGGQDWKNHHNLGRFYQQRGKLDIAEKTLKKALSLSPKDSIETRLVLCELYLDQGEATRALLEIERVIKINPTAKAWFLRGRAYFDLESYQEAEEDFRRATLADPQFHDARGAIGTVKIAMGDLEGAAQAFRTTLRFDPSNSAAQQNLKLVEKELAKRSTPPQ